MLSSHALTPKPSACGARRLECQSTDGSVTGRVAPSTLRRQLQTALTAHIARISGRAVRLRHDWCESTATHLQTERHCEGPQVALSARCSKAPSRDSRPAHRGTLQRQRQRGSHARRRGCRAEANHQAARAPAAARDAPATLACSHQPAWRHNPP